MKKYSHTYSRLRSFLPLKLVCSFMTLLLLSVTVLGADGELPLKDGDKIVFWGDSITDLGWYTPYLQLALAIKMKDDDIRVFNSGVGGDTTGRAMHRLDYDVFSHKPSYVFIFLGENDLNRNLYTKPEMTKAKQQRLDRALKNTSQAVDLIKEHSAKAVIIGTSTFDQYSKLGAPNYKYYNTTGKKLLNDELRKLAANCEAPFIDLYTPMTAVVSKHPEMHLCGRDRIHPSRTGHLLIALEILRAIGIKKRNSTVTVDSGKVFPQNAKVKNLSFSDCRVSFKYLPDTLPLPADLQFLELRKISSLPMEVNQEIICVKGLKPGKYDLKIDGKTIAAVTDEELANGFNIASLDTPNQKLAKELVTLMTKWRNTTTPLRKIAAATMIAKIGQADLEDTASIDKAIDEWLESCKESPAYSGRKRMIEAYRKNRSQQKEYENRLTYLVKSMRQKAKPVWCKIEIQKQK